MNNPLPGIAYCVLVVVSSIWVAWDSSRFKLVRYNTGLSYKPLLLFFLMVPIWYVSFPWYLVVRAKIKAGKLSAMNEPNQPRCYGLRSRRAKFGMLAIAAGIVIALVFRSFSWFAGAPEERLSIVGMIVLSSAMISVIFGGIVVLFTLFAGWGNRVPNSS